MSSAVLFGACELIGYQVVKADDYGPGEVYELRNCAAGGTMNLLAWTSDASVVSEIEIGSIVEFIAAATNVAVKTI